jgi:polar amino acid transport system substrate-binding protein
MKRIQLVVVGVGFAALLAATVALAQPSATTGTTRAAAKAKLPPLPADVKSRNRWIVGVKCDVPPFGYIDVKGKNAGFDVEIGRWFSRYAFGRDNRVSFVCAPTAAREPLLTNNRVDLVISTFTYTADRDTRIDFSRAYYKATGRLLVKNDGPVQKLSDIRGKKVATTSGSVYDRWLKRCFPDTEAIVADTFTNALLAFQQGRADAVMYDDAVLLPVAAADRTAKLTDDSFLEAPFGIGIRQGYTEMKAWVDSRLELMRKKDQFLPILKDNVPARFVTSFSQNILRPSNTFTYAAPGAPSVDTVCP